MSRKFLALIICVLLVFLTAACGKSNENTNSSIVLKGRMTAVPDYSLSENAGAEDMRKTAVRAMKDELSVQWYPEKDFSYMKSGTAKNKIYKFSTDKIYCGLPYTNGDGSLLQWLQYYDFETGKLDKSVLSGYFYRNFGNACATSVMWGWNAVCPDIMWDSCSNMTPQNGCIPVEGYKYPEKITDYREITTRQIAESNGEQAMFAAYANTSPADAVMSFSTPDNFNHVVMVYAKPEVVYNLDGTINGEKSKLFIQDQRSGSTIEKVPYLKFENGEKHQYSGRINYPLSFKFLYGQCYIPLTCAQFSGQKPYVKATASLEGNAPATYKELTAATVRSNYNIVAVNITFTDKASGKQAAKEKYVRINNYWDKTKDKAADKEYALTYKMNNKKDGIFLKDTVCKSLKSGSTYNTEIKVTVATGQALTAFSGEIKY